MCCIHLSVCRTFFFLGPVWFISCLLGGNRHMSCAITTELYIYWFRNVAIDCIDWKIKFHGTPDCRIHLWNWTTTTLNCTFSFQSWDERIVPILQPTMSLFYRVIFFSWNSSSSYIYSVPDLVKKKKKTLYSFFLSFRIFTGNLQVNSNNPDIYSRLNLYKIPKLLPWIVNKISSTASSSAFLSDWSPPSRGWDDSETSKPPRKKKPK